jgi:plastocyanin
MKALLLAVVMLGASASTSTANATVHIKDFAYDPATITVASGAVVRFVNDDGEAHTVTARDKSFDSAGLDTGDAWTHRFTKPGTYAYFCALHPYMHGVVVVRAAGGTQ